jgi:anti-sigma B factor antagonist
MRAEALDITIQSRDGAVWLHLAGPFHAEQAPNIREKILSLMQDGNREIIVDLNDVTHVDTGVPSLFLELLNTMRAKDGELRFIFKNDAVTKAFAPYRNLLDIHPDAEELMSGGLLGALRRRTQVLFRRTGIRLSRPVAIFLLVVLCSLFVSLAFIINLQSRRIAEQSREVEELRQWRQSAVAELDKLTSRLKPMEALGLLPDTSELPRIRRQIQALRQKTAAATPRAPATAPLPDTTKPQAPQQPADADSVAPTPPAGG